jgi:hypothetical protein
MINFELAAFIIALICLILLTSILLFIWRLWRNEIKVDDFTDDFTDKMDEIEYHNKRLNREADRQAKYIRFLNDKLTDFGLDLPKEMQFYHDEGLLDFDEEDNYKEMRDKDTIDKHRDSKF